MTEKPKTASSLAQKELDKAEKQFEKFDQEVKEMTMDRLNAAPKEESEPQTKIAQKDLEKMKDVYLKPFKTVSCRDKFNEKFREQYEYDKQYVQFTAEHKEIIGDEIEIWTRPYGGMHAEFWRVPTNKPVWGPRYLAEQIKRARYARLVMQDKRITGSDQNGQYFGSLAVDTIVQRLDAHSVSTKKSVFMGASSF
jgi:hypothetical protein